MKRQKDKRAKGYRHSVLFSMAVVCLISVAVVCLNSCGEYQKLLKSTDSELKYTKAIEYFDAKQYVKAQTLFDDVAPYYKGTDRSQDVLNYLARCYMGQKDYTGAAEYYNIYIRNYPKGRYIAEARYMIGHCYYLDSPDPRLDQEITQKAIDALIAFVELYPESPYVADAYKEINEMYNKLAYKELLSAKLYYNLGTYLGNNYESCVIVAKNALQMYPGNEYQEELCWYILQAKYQLAVNSIAIKAEERYRDADDEYYNFKTEFPESKYLKTAERLHQQIQKALNH